MSARSVPEPGRPGLVWVFFNDPAMNRPADLGTDAQINLDTGATIHDYARVWLGRVKAPRAGEVLFTGEADNGFRLWLDDKLVIDGWTGAETKGKWLFRERNTLVPFRVEFFQLGGSAHLRLYWKWPDHPRELIPASALWHTDKDMAQARALRAGALKKEAVFRLETKAKLYAPRPGVRRPEPIHLGTGPHLFIDDYLIESSTRVKRRVNRPVRDPSIPNPLVTGREDHCFQPYLTVLREATTGRFRLWYGAYGDDRNPTRSHLAYMESRDGVHWIRPARVLADPAPIQFGTSVVDDGPQCPDPDRRYKCAWWYGGGLRVAASPDGLTWTPLSEDVVLFHNHDINSLFWDPLRKRYVATVSVYEPGPTWSGLRRVTMQSYTKDLLTWTTPHYVLTPNDAVDQGKTQFYAMDGFLVRGGLTIGLVKVLRDDLKADDPPDPPNQYGIGYTTLAWTRDGETWVRDRQPFFDRDPRKGTWDHAHAWIDEQVLVGDEVYLYYAGYARGHKVNRFEERQLGLVRMRRDRYVAREAGSEGGELTTPLLTLDGDELTLNVDSRKGAARVEVAAEDGTPLPGFTLADCRPVTGDDLEAPVRWKRSLRVLRGRPVHLRFVLRNARLFGFECR